MKRNSNSDTLGALMSMCTKSGEDSPRSNNMHTREYEWMVDGVDEEGCMEEYGHVHEKKRRLRVDQVKALERNFEVENKLEPERKVKLAQELGLQPRQVAVWFQNRRARWKTKQLERDYGVLKSKFDSLHQNYESLMLDKQALLKEIKELKLKLNEENPDENTSIEEEETTEAVQLDSVTVVSQDEKKLKVKSDSLAFPSEFKSDGQSDSDSSAILNDEQINPNYNNNNASNSSTSSFIFNSCSSSSPPPSLSHCFSFSNPNSEGVKGADKDNVYHPQFVKQEEYNFFGVDEGCNFFADEEQAPSLHWYSADQWA